MNEQNIIGIDSQAVQSHLSITQSVIQRMASNSASCKGWCIALVSAVLVIVADKGKPDYALIALVPAVLFLVLDVYYLGLERAFRKSYNEFIDKLHSGEIQTTDVYAVTPSGNLFVTCFCALVSFSIWPFYLTLLAMILVARRYVI